MIRMDPPATTQNPTRSAILAWLVHMLTASSAVLALLALAAIEQQRWQLALLWLVGALAIDGIDGTLARLARVKLHARRLDGDTLDLIVDYLTYVFVPTIFLWRAGLVPEPIAPWLAALIQVSSLYLFARRDLKTEDNYFRGFPALWNVIAFYLFVGGPGPGIGAVVVVVFSLLTFAPLLFVHPFRVADFQPWLGLTAVLWAASTAALLWPDWNRSFALTLLAASLATAALLLGAGLFRTIRGPADRPR
jgi:phosphatidylcholine synthase